MVPRTPSIRNHTSMKGPKYRPIRPVPACCMRNMRKMISRTIGTTGTAGATRRSPSMADVTVMAGVITPSAMRAAAPIAATR